MKHIVHLSKSWEIRQLTPNGSSVYECRLSRNQECFFANGVRPHSLYAVTEDRYNTIYLGTDKQEAEEVLKEMRQQMILARGKEAKLARVKSLPDRAFDVVSIPNQQMMSRDPYELSGHLVLPENQFQVRELENGNVIVCPGEDTTNKALVFLDFDGGTVRHGVCDTVRICRDRNTASRIIRQVYKVDGNAVSVIALLKPGQSVVFHTDAYTGTEGPLSVFTWNGNQIEHRRFSESDWNEEYWRRVNLEGSTVL